MARFLGVGCVLKSPRTTRTYVVAAAPQWQDISQPLRPPAHLIGVGGFGATYRVVDDRGETFAMKEYFPRDHAVRGADGRIAPKRSEDGFSKKIYEEGLRRFVAEGHLLTSFSHPNVLRVVDAFDDNGTSYQLMRLVEGREALGESDTGAARIERRVTFEDFLRELEAAEVPVELSLIRSTVKQLLDAVQYIHTEGARKAQEITGAATKGLLHRDIKPSNILIEAPDGMRDAPAADILRHPDTKVILIDFGSARIFRDAQTDDASRSIGVVTEGYAPPELKDNDVESQGPHSDIYSIAAVIWRALTGRKPTTAQLANGAKLADLAQPVRGANGEMTPRAPRAFLQAVDRALNAAVSLRPQSIADWRLELNGKGAGGGGRQQQQQQKKKTAEDGQTQKKSSAGAWIGGLSLAAVFGVGLMIMNGGGGPEKAIVSQATAAASDAENAVSQGDQAAERAIQAIQDAQTAATAGLVKAADGRTLFSQAQASADVHHAAGYGSKDEGDTEATFRLLTGANVTWWCYKKGPTITPDVPYFQQSNGGELKIDGVPGYSCNYGHTHHHQASTDTPHNPWRVEAGGYTYAGEVDAQEHPAGLGQMSAGIITYAGKFTPAGANFDLTGASGGYGARTYRGQLHLDMSAAPKVETATGEVTFTDGTKFRGDYGAARNLVGVYTGATLTRTGVMEGDRLVGNITTKDGDKIWMAGDDAHAWGRIERNGDTYLGEIVKRRPGGCGVWKRGDGSKEVGFYQDGRKQEGALPDQCKTPHYSKIDTSQPLPSSGPAVVK